MTVRKHPQVAAHQDEADDHEPAGKDPKAGGNIHT
jgi:hypothetical protein